MEDECSPNIFNEVWLKTWNSRDKSEVAFSVNLLVIVTVLRIKTMVCNKFLKYHFCKWFLIEVIKRATAGEETFKWLFIKIY